MTMSKKNVVQVIPSSRFNSGHHEKSLWKVKPTDLRLILSERERYVVRIIIKSVNIKAVFELLVTYRHSKGQPS